MFLSEFVTTQNSNNHRRHPVLPSVNLSVYPHITAQKLCNQKVLNLIYTRIIVPKLYRFYRFNRNGKKIETHINKRFLFFSQILLFIIS